MHFRVSFFHAFLCSSDALPSVECVDQLKHVRLVNPRKEAWGKLVDQTPFKRAVHAAQVLRRRFLRRTLAAVGLKPKRSNPDVVETMTDVFEGGLTVRQDDAELPAVAFYSGCVCTSRGAGGVLVQRGADRDAGVLWLHGPSSNVLGGEAWKQGPTANSLPACVERATVKTLDAFGRAGWNKANGFVKIEPMWFV